MRDIIIFLRDLRGGGVERIRLELAREFKRRGHNVRFLLLSKSGELIEEAEKDFELDILDAKRMRNVPLKLYSYLRDNKSSHLLTAMWPLSAIAPIVAKLAGVSGSVVVSEHNTLSIQFADRSVLSRCLIRLMTFIGYRMADSCIAVSSGVRDDMLLLSKAPKDKIKVVYNPLRALQDPTEIELKYFEGLWRSASPKILSVGSFKDQKNQALLIRAFAKLNIKSAKLCLAGAGPNESILRRLAADLNVADQLIFCGFVKDPAALYMSADLFVLPSNYEGFGNVIVESLSVGCPVVSTNCKSGPAEILSDGEFGLLVDVGDVEGMTEAIREAISMHHDKRRLIGRSEDFSLKACADKYMMELIK